MRKGGVQLLPFAIPFTRMEIDGSG
jgi:hypothetical protein